MTSGYLYPHLRSTISCGIVVRVHRLRLCSHTVEQVRIFLNFLEKFRVRYHRYIHRLATPQPCQFQGKEKKIVGWIPSNRAAHLAPLSVGHPNANAAPTRIQLTAKNRRS